MHASTACMLYNRSMNACSMHAIGALLATKVYCSIPIIREISRLSEEYSASVFGVLLEDLGNGFLERA